MKEKDLEMGQKFFNKEKKNMLRERTKMTFKQMGLMRNTNQVCIYKALFSKEFNKLKIGGFNEVLTQLKL